jgi:hypothetical protein
MELRLSSEIQVSEVQIEAQSWINVLLGSLKLKGIYFTRLDELRGLLIGGMNLCVAATGLSSGFLLMEKPRCAGLLTQQNPSINS